MQYGNTTKKFLLQLIHINKKQLEGMEQDGKLKVFTILTA
jgi:hypothetical protein